MRYSDVSNQVVLPLGFHSVTPRMVVSDVAAEVEFLRAVFDATGDVHADNPCLVRDISIFHCGSFHSGRKWPRRNCGTAGCYTLRERGMRADEHKE